METGEMQSEAEDRTGKCPYRQIYALQSQEGNTINFYEYCDLPFDHPGEHVCKYGKRISPYHIPEWVSRDRHLPDNYY